jgi:hypothetical protein
MQSTAQSQPIRDRLCSFCDIEGGFRMPIRKQATKRAPVPQVNRILRDARVQRATRRDRTAPGSEKIEDIVADHGFHAPAEEIEIDPQLDENETTEP